MKKQEVKEADFFSTHLPQTRNREVTHRIMMGKTLRQRTPRKSHATWTSPSDRRDPVEQPFENDAQVAHQP